MDEAKQGKLLPREFLSNLAEGVPLTVWYDWHDDSADPQDPESHFGIVHFPYSADTRPVYSPKPAYLALKTLSGALDGYRFTRRLPVGGANDFVLLFTKGTEIRLAAWTTSAASRKAAIPDLQGQFAITDYLGQSLKPARAHKGKLAITADRCATIPGAAKRVEALSQLRPTLWVNLDFECPKGINIISRRRNLRANGDQLSISGDPEGVEHAHFNPFGVGGPHGHIFSVGFTYG